MVKRRKSNVAPPPSGSSLKECMRLFGRAWTTEVMWYLREGERCFTELQHDVKGISAKMLVSRLRKLERERVVTRTIRQTSPPTVWYSLTPVGQELCAALTVVVEVTQRPKQG
jgi:DNA-binding HxlR family transcriptional regulator